MVFDMHTENSIATSAYTSLHFGTDSVRMQK